jgi:hypothetical protein
MNSKINNTFSKTFKNYKNILFIQKIYKKFLSFFLHINYLFF